jgi:hypothetical protein
MFYSPYFSWGKGEYVSLLMKYPRSTFYMCESGILLLDYNDRYVSYSAVKGPENIALTE